MPSERSAQWTNSTPFCTIPFVPKIATPPYLAYDRVRLNTPPCLARMELGWEWRSPVLPDYDLWFIFEGVGKMELNATRYDMGPGTFFLFTPGSRFHATQDPSRRILVFWVHFSILDSRGLMIPPPQLNLPSHGRILRDADLFRSMAQKCEAVYRRADALGAVQSRLLLEQMLLHLWEETIHPVPSILDSRIHEIVSAIQRDPSMKWSLNDLARKLNMSRSLFTRHFRRITKVSPVHFMIQARLNRAAQLIRESDISLTEVANMLGYNDLYFFSRQFKKFMGHPPSGLRRDAAEAEPRISKGKSSRKKSSRR